MTVPTKAFVRSYNAGFINTARQMMTQGNLYQTQGGVFTPAEQAIKEVVERRPHLGMAADAIRSDIAPTYVAAVWVGERNVGGVSFGQFESVAFGKPAQGDDAFVYIGKNQTDTAPTALLRLIAHREKGGKIRHVPMALRWFSDNETLKKPLLKWYDGSAEQRAVISSARFREEYHDFSPRINQLIETQRKAAGLEERAGWETVREWRHDVWDAEDTVFNWKPRFSTELLPCGALVCASQKPGVMLGVPEAWTYLAVKVGSRMARPGTVTKLSPGQHITDGAHLFRVADKGIIRRNLPGYARA